MLQRLKRQRHHFIEALEVRLLLSSSKPTSSSILPQFTPQAFTDDFDRPDSTVVGNGWTNMAGSNGQDLGIVNGKLSGLSPSGDVGIYRPWSPSQTVTVSCVLTYLSGYASTPYRYDASIAFDSDGTIGDGYGIHLTRGDANYNDSAISIFDGNTVLSTTPCSFQFSSDVSLTVTFASDGSISGNVSDETDAPFPFALGPHAIESAGVNFAYWVALPDPRASSYTEPTLDNLTIQSAGVAGSGPQAPTGLQALQGTAGTEVQLSWNDSQGATSYNVWRSSTSNDPATAALIATDLSSPSYSDTSVSLGHTYYYWVVANGTTASSSMSGPVSVVLNNSLTPTAVLVNPLPGNIVAVEPLNSRHYVDIFFDEPGQTGVNERSILDNAPEFTVSGAAARGVTFLGKPQVENNSVYRYHFKGKFAFGDATFSFIPGAWSDSAGIMDSASQETLRLGVSELKLIASRRGHGSIPVDITRAGGGPIDPSDTTWIVIHGRDESSLSDDIITLASAVVAERPDDQVLTLDWKRGAAPKSFLTDFTGQDWTQAVGIAAGIALQSYGFSGSSLNLIGHSWGAYVATNLAQQFGTVNSILALDPARYVPTSGLLGSALGIIHVHGGTYNTDSINFSTVSKVSWAFRSSVYGSPVTPGTASRAVEANVGPFLAVSAHTNVVYLLAAMLTNDANSSGDKASEDFALEHLENDDTEPWGSATFPDNIDSGLYYNAVLNSDSSNRQVAELMYIDAATGDLVSLG